MCVCVYVYTHIHIFIFFNLFIHRLPGCFHSWDIMNKAAVNTGTDISPRYQFYFLWWITRNGFSGSYEMLTNGSEFSVKK